MQAAEALQLLITLGDELLNLHPSQRPANENKDREELALAVSQAMLNSMIPVARYRAFVEVDEEQPKRSKYQESIAITGEFTICSVNMAGIRGGMIGLSHVPTKVRVMIFEQRATGADVLTAYQGETKTVQFKRFLEGLHALETLPTVN